MGGSWIFERAKNSLFDKDIALIRISVKKIGLLFVFDKGSTAPSFMQVRRSNVDRSRICGLLIKSTVLLFFYIFMVTKSNHLCVSIFSWVLWGFVWSVDIWWWKYIMLLLIGYFFYVSTTSPNGRRIFRKCMGYWGRDCVLKSYIEDMMILQF